MNSYRLMGDSRTRYEISGMIAYGGETVLLSETLAQKHSDVIISLAGNKVEQKSVDKPVTESVKVEKKTETKKKVTKK